MYCDELPVMVQTHQGREENKILEAAVSAPCKESVIIVYCCAHYVFYKFAS